MGHIPQLVHFLYNHTDVIAKHLSNFVFYVHVLEIVYSLLKHLQYNLNMQRQNFESTWNELLGILVKGTEIRTISYKSTSTVVSRDASGITIVSRKGNTRRIAKKDVEAVWDCLCQWNSVTTRKLIEEGIYPKVKSHIAVSMTMLSRLPEIVPEVSPREIKWKQ